MHLLHIDSSALGANSVTRQLTAAIVSDWQQANPALTVAYRDLDRHPLPHLSGSGLSRTDSDAAAVSDLVLDQFLKSDVVVVGAPMYNFGIPSTLKAWIDRVAVAGKTFRYTADGPEGLAGNKRVIVALAAGGQHAGQPTDFVEPYLRQVFGFLGVTDPQFVRADGVALSPEHGQSAIDAALASVGQALSKAA